MDNNQPNHQNQETTPNPTVSGGFGVKEPMSGDLNQNTNMRAFVNNRQGRSKMLLIGVVGCLSVTALVFAFWTAVRPGRKTVPTPTFSESQPIPTNIEISYTGPILKIPDKLNVYQSKTTSLDEAAQIFIEYYGLALSDTDLWMDQAGNVNLFIDRVNNQIQINVSPEESEGDGLNKSSAQANVENLLENVGLANKLKLDGYDYLQGTIEVMKTNNEAAASFIQFAYNQKVDGYPIYYNNLPRETVVILTDKNNQVIKITYMPVLDVQPYLSGQKTINENTLLELVRSGRGEMFEASVDNNPYYKPNIDEVSSMTLSSYVVEYRFVTTTGLLYPYVVFGGEAVLNNSTNATVGVGVSAINTN